MGNTANKEDKKLDLKKEAVTFSNIFSSTKISIPNEKRDNQIAEDQISILELFISPSKDICILILKEKTFTGDFQPIYYVQIYYYDSIKNKFVIVLNHIIKDEIHCIDKAVYDPNNNYILMYNTLKDINDDKNKFFLFKFDFLTKNNPKLGMNGYNMTKLIHPQINSFGKCCYATFLRKASDLLFVFERGYFILLTYNESTKQYDHINYFSSRSSYKYLTKKRKKSSNTSDKKRKRGYRVIMASVHEKRDRITWIECEYNHYYLQILSLKCLLNHKRKPSESKEYYNNNSPPSSSTSSKQYHDHSRISAVSSAPINIPESISSSSGPPSPSLSFISKKSNNIHHINAVIKITPISIDIQQYLIVSRLIFANQKNMETIRCIFAEEYDLEYFHNRALDDYGATKYRGVVRKKHDSINENTTKYVLDSFFGINPLSIKLLFNRDGDKILFQSAGQNNMLHNDYDQRLTHGDQYSGNLNHFGGLHVIDVTTGLSVWSLGSSSKDIGFGWFNSYLIVLPSIKSASGLAASKSIYKPHKQSRSLSMSAMHSISAISSISSRQTHKKSSIARCKHSHLQLFGFVSYTNIAETIYNKCDNINYLNQFSWDLCVLLAIYCGGMREYRQLSLTKYVLKNRGNGYHKKNGKNNVKYLVSDIKLINNEILSIWNTNDNYYNLDRSEKRDWLIIAIKEYRNRMRYIDIVFYDAKQIAMHKEDIFIPYHDNDGLICRNLLGNSNTFDSLYYASD